MVPREQRFIYLSLISGLALALLLAGLFGISPASAYQQPSELALSESLPLAAQQPTYYSGGYYTETLSPPTDVYDLAGNLVFEGSHSGEFKCNGDKCNQRTELSPSTNLWKIEYKFATGQAVDPDARIVVVAGTGTIDRGGGMKERFSFTATFEDNRDGTIKVTYFASRPDASFSIPAAPGRMEFLSR